MQARELTAIFSLAGLLMACPKPTDTAQPAQGGGRASAGPSAEASRLDPNLVVATWEGGQMTYAELQKKGEANFTRMRNQYLMELHTQEQQLLEATVVEGLVKKAAAAKGQTEEQYFESIVGKPSATEAEILEFYEQVAKQSGQPIEALRPRIEEYLVNKKKQEAFMGEIDKLKTAAKVNINLPAPEQAKVKFELAGRPMKGKETAKVTIVEFSDFECPYCAKATPGVEQILAAYPDDVKLYFLHFPLSFHQKAMPAAVASECAHKQGKFWEMHDELFAAQHSLTEEHFKEAATKRGLDLVAFEGCMKDPAIAATIKSDMVQAEAAGVQGTPSFYINGVRYEQGVPTVDAVRAALAGS